MIDNKTAAALLLSTAILLNRSDAPIVLSANFNTVAVKFAPPLDFSREREYPLFTGGVYE